MRWSKFSTYKYAVLLCFKKVLFLLGSTHFMGNKTLNTYMYLIMCTKFYMKFKHFSVFSIFHGG